MADARQPDQPADEQPFVLVETFLRHGQNIIEEKNIEIQLKY
jgi:hypothetical protein